MPGLSGMVFWGYAVHNMCLSVFIARTEWYIRSLL